MNFNPASPTKYRGTDQYIVPVVKRKYTPTTADYRQPETGRNYPLGCLWILGANPTDGLEGDIYILAKIVSNLATWVPYNTGISGPLLSLTVDAATSPGTVVVLPSSTTSTITITGGQVAASSIGVNAIQTNSIAHNNFGVLIQQAGSAASASLALNGIASFSTAAFTVTNGFVTLNSINLATQVTGILPVANGGTSVGTLTGYLVGNGTSAITGLGSGIDSIAITGHTGVPVLLANSATPGYVLTANSGGPPTWQVNAAVGDVTSVTAAGTNRLTATPNTGAVIIDISANYAGQATITTVGALSSGSLVSGFTPVTVPLGGTGASTLTGYLVGNGTSAVTGLGSATDNAVAVTNNSGSASLLANGTPGYVLTANSSAPPSWQPAPGSSTGFTTIVDRVFTSSGTYTPTTSMKYCIVECIGAGGGGAGVTSVASSFYVGGAGGGGGYARIVLTAASVGASKAVTIGAAGAGGAAGTNNGGNGGTTSLGTLCSAGGGLGGISSTALGTSSVVLGGNGGVGTVGDFVTTGSPGGFGIGSSSDSYTLSGTGGSSFFGGGGNSVSPASSASTAGNNATSYGGGGGGAASNSVNASSKAGGNGGAGIVIITEYI